MTRKDLEHHLFAYTRLRNMSKRSTGAFGPLDYMDLERLATRLRAILTRECNGYADTDWGRNQKARDERASWRIEKAAKLICDEQLGLPLAIQGDPRGPSFIIGHESEGVRL